MHVPSDHSVKPKLFLLPAHGLNTVTGEPAHLLWHGKQVTAKNMLSAVKVLNNWLSSNCQETRHIEDIPPAELDPYLAHFFSTARNKANADYHPSSFRALRSFIERYLQQVLYPCSIVKSDIFLSSQIAYKTRLIDLEKQQQSKKKSE